MSGGVCGTLSGSITARSGQYGGKVSYEVLEGFAGSTDLYISETNPRLSERG